MIHGLIVVLLILCIVVKNETRKKKRDNIVLKEIKRIGITNNIILNNKAIYNVTVNQNHNSFERAIEYLDRLYKNNKISKIDLLKVKGVIFESISKDIDASDCYEEALKLNKNDKNLMERIDELNYKIASNFINNDQADKALVFLKTVSHLEEGESTVNTLNNMSWAANSSYKYDEALEYSNYGLEKDINDYYLLTNKGNALFGLEKYKEAIEVYKRVLELAPKNYSHGWYGIAISNFYLKNYIESEKGFKEYLKIKKSNDGLYYLVRSLQAQWKYEEVVAVLDEAISERMDIAWYYNSKGYSLYCIGKYHKAIECFDKAIALSEGFEDAYYNKCLIYTEFFIIDGAFEMLKKSIEYDNSYAELAKEDKALEILRDYNEFNEIVS